MRELDDKDDFRMDDGFYFAFLYKSGDGQAPDKRRGLRRRRHPE
jgi:hypothetical protein